MMVDFNLENKVAIVTGGAGILGQRFCNALAKCGAHVVIGDINYECAESIAQEIQAKYKVKTLALDLDVSCKESTVSAVDNVISEFGRIDILHNNAASKGKDLSSFFASFEDYELETWNEILSVNISGMFLMAQSVGQQMKRQDPQGGSIIQTASIYGIMAPDERIYEGSEYMGKEINAPAVYGVSKAGVIALSKYLAARWAKYNIRVNTLTPGGVSSGQNSVFAEKYANRVPLERMADKDEMTGALLYLASSASSYVTGHNLVVDGGLSVW